MDAREERGLQIAATCKIEKNKLGWKVPSQSGNGSYIVNLDHGTSFAHAPIMKRDSNLANISTLWSLLLSERLNRMALKLLQSL